MAIIIRLQFSANREITSQIPFFINGRRDYRMIGRGPASGTYTDQQFIDCIDDLERPVKNQKLKIRLKEDETGDIETTLSFIEKHSPLIYKSIISENPDLAKYSLSKSASLRNKQNVFETATSSYTFSASDIPRHGGSGTVLLVHDENRNEYALKTLSPENITTKKIKRFKNELLFCFKNDHSNIIKVLDWGYLITENNKKCPFYVMPFYKKTLRDLIKAGISNEKALRYFSQILNGVEAAHIKGHWHRDLKPENILYDEPKDTLIVADWGIAHFKEDELHTTVATKPQERLANFMYAAPEQRIKGVTVDHRADIFALGMLLNEIFTNVVPIGSGYKTIKSVNDAYAYLDDLVELMIKNSVDDRPQSIDVVRQQFVAEEEKRQRILKNVEV